MFSYIALGLAFARAECEAKFLKCETWSTFHCHALAQFPRKSNFEALPGRPEKLALEGHFEPFLVELGWEPFLRSGGVFLRDFLLRVHQASHFHRSHAKPNF